MPKSKRATSRKKGLKNLLFLLALGLVPLMMTPEAQANTFDTEKVYYQGVLKDDDENPLTGQYTFRFSAWLTQDFISGEVVGGEIVTASPQYLDWQEAQTQDIVDGDSFVVSVKYSLFQKIYLWITMCIFK